MLLQLGPSLPTLLHSHLDHSLLLWKRSIDIQISLKQFWFKSYRLLEAVHILSTVIRPRSAPSARTFAPHSSSPPGVAQRDPHNCGINRRPFRTIIQLSSVLDHEQVALTQPRCLPAARRARAQPNRSRPYHTTPIPRPLRSHQVVPSGVHGHITSFLLRKDLYHLVRCLWMTSTISQDLNRSGQETGTMSSRLTPQSSSGMKKMKRLKRRK